jgi:hypothetical protein
VQLERPRDAPINGPDTAFAPHTPTPNPQRRASNATPPVAPMHSKAYVVGERGIVDELAAMGIESIGGPDHNGLCVDGKELDIDPEARGTWGGWQARQGRIRGG